MGDDSLADKKERLLERAEGFAELGMFKEAIDACKSLVSLDLADPASLVELGIQHELKGDKEEAIKHLKDGIERFPQYFRTYVALGFWFEKHRGRNDIAMVCYEKSLELNPNDEWAFYNIGRMLHYSGKWKESVSYYEKSYDGCKQEGLRVGRTLHGLAWAYYRLKKYKKATEMFRRIVEEDAAYLEEQNDVRADFGCVQYRLGSFDKALALIEEAVMRRPDRRRYIHLRRLFLGKISLLSLNKKKITSRLS